MGTDCTMVVERKKYIGYVSPSADMDDKGGYIWEMIGAYALPRNHEAFEDISYFADTGFPPYVDSRSRSYLEKTEDWGECSMPYKSFLALNKTYKLFPNIYKKKEYSNLRCIFRFDN